MPCKMVQVARNQKPGSVPVYLNVYDLTHINGYAYWLGLGIYHSGVQVHGVEYGFGAHDHATTGIFEVEPRSCSGFTFRKSILIGRTDLGPREVHAFMEKLAKEYSGNTYNLISKNCNHFCNDVCIRLTQKPIPRWVNRLARIGLFCNCVLPAELNETKIRQVQSKNRPLEEEKKKLRSHSSRFPSFSTSNDMSSSRFLRSLSRNSGERQCLPTPSSLIHSASTTNPSFKT